MLAKNYTDFGVSLAFIGWSGAAWGHAAYRGETHLQARKNRFLTDGF